MVFNAAHLAHLNFVGDSIVGSGVNLEAGAHTANHWNEREEKRVSVVLADGPVVTDLKKLGSMIGDRSRVGANAVLSPGTILPPATVVPRLSLIEQ